MSIELQLKIKESSNNLKYLRENSNWYKNLNRSNNYYKYFEDEMKSKYKLTTKDRLNKFMDSLDTISRLMDILN